MNAHWSSPGSQENAQKPQTVWINQGKLFGGDGFWWSIFQIFNKKDPTKRNGNDDELALKGKTTYSLTTFNLDSVTVGNPRNCSDYSKPTPLAERDRALFCGHQNSGFRKDLIRWWTKPDEGRAPFSAAAGDFPKGRVAGPFCAGPAGRAGAARCRAGTFRESEPCISESCSSTGLCPRTSKPWAISTWRTSLGDIRLLVLARPSASCRNGRQVMPPPRPLNPDSWGSSVVFSSKTGFLTAPGGPSTAKQGVWIKQPKTGQAALPQVRREPAASSTYSLLGHFQFPRCSDQLCESLRSPGVDEGGVSQNLLQRPLSSTPRSPAAVLLVCTGQPV